MSATKVRASNIRLIAVEKVTIPPWSTIGYARGVDEQGRHVHFVGDHRPLRQLAEARAGADEPILVEVEPWQVLSIDETG
jgi:hypothetical protein